MSIFAKCQVGPSQLRTVAARRLDDADALRKTGRNARANGAMYLGGFVVECLLKAQLLRRFPWLQNAGSPGGRPRSDHRLWSLCYRSHDLDEILAELPAITVRLSRLEQGESTRLTRSLQSICAEWTIFARYSPQTATMDEASEFLDQIKELKRWLE